VRDRERRAAVDYRDDGGARGRGANHTRQRHVDPRRFERLRFADHLFLDEIDEVGAGRGADGCSHDTLCVRSAPTSAVARRAAETGARRWDLPARYAAENASPEPVGSVAIGQAPTHSARPFAYTHDPRKPYL